MNNSADIEMSEHELLEKIAELERILWEKDAEMSYLRKRLDELKNDTEDGYKDYIGKCIIFKKSDTKCIKIEKVLIHNNLNVEFKGHGFVINKLSTSTVTGISDNIGISICPMSYDDENSRLVYDIGRELEVIDEDVYDSLMKEHFEKILNM